MVRKTHLIWLHDGQASWLSIEGDGIPSPHHLGYPKARVDSRLDTSESDNDKVRTEINFA